MEQLLALEMIRVTEAAAIESARFMGRGEKDAADAAATEAMRSTMDEIDFAGRIVIGEGERDEAPMLYIGERVGRTGADREDVPRVDIAVDPLEGTNLVAHGQAGAITVLAASEAGGLTHAPDTYMEKLCVGPVVAGKVDRSWFTVNLFSEQISQLKPAERLTLPPLSSTTAAHSVHRGQLEIWPWIALVALGVVVVEWLAFHRGL